MHEDLIRRSPWEYERHPCTNRSDFAQLTQVFGDLGWISRFRCRAKLNCVVGGRNVRMVESNFQGFQLWLNPKYLSTKARKQAQDVTVDDGCKPRRPGHMHDGSHAHRHPSAGLGVGKASGARAGSR